MFKCFQAAVPEREEKAAKHPDPSSQNCKKLSSVLPIMEKVVKFDGCIHVFSGVKQLKFKGRYSIAHLQRSSSISNAKSRAAIF